MRFIISDVTYMAREICLAGWDPDRRCMVRPLSGVGRHWPLSTDGRQLFAMGDIVEGIPANIRNARGPPHSREDVILRGSMRTHNVVPQDEVARSLSESESPTVVDLFENALRENRFVMAGADCPSLGAVRVARNAMRFFEKTWETRKKLRCQFVDGSGHRYDLPVTAVQLQDVWSDSGLAALDESIRGAGNAHVRLGLAHPMGDGRAFAMVNGVALY